MNNFERITASPETLGTFLASLPIADGPWDTAFCKIFCDVCNAENCPKNCPNEAVRNNPLWWLNQEADDERTARRWEQRDGYLMMEPGEIVPLENPLRVQIRALREDPLIAVAEENAETRLGAALRMAEEVKKAYPDAEISIKVDV